MLRSALSRGFLLRGGAPARGGARGLAHEAPKDAAHGKGGAHDNHGHGDHGHGDHGHGDYGHHGHGGNEPGGYFLNLVVRMAACFTSCWY